MDECIAIVLLMLALKSRKISDTFIGKCIRVVLTIVAENYHDFMCNFLWIILEEKSLRNGTRIKVQKLQL